MCIRDRFEELGRKFRRKLTRGTILDMMESGDLTMEEREMELRDLESRENKDSEMENDKHNVNKNESVTPGHFKTLTQQLPEERHATIAPSTGQENIQRPKQLTYGGKERIDPKYNDKEKCEHGDNFGTPSDKSKCNGNKDVDCIDSLTNHQLADYSMCLRINTMYRAREIYSYRKGGREK